MVILRNHMTNKYKTQIAETPNHSHEIDDTVERVIFARCFTHEIDDTVEWVSVYLRKCVICRLRKIYSKKMFYCKVCKRYAHKRCLETEDRKTEPRARFANTVLENDRTATAAGTTNGFVFNTERQQNNYDAFIIPDQQSYDDSDDEGLWYNYNYPEEQSQAVHWDNEPGTSSNYKEFIVNNKDLEVTDKRHPMSLKIERLTEENECLKQTMKILEDKLEDKHILLRKIDLLKSLVVNRLRLADVERKPRNGSENSVPETRQLSTGSSCGFCGLSKNELKTLKTELEKLNIPNTPSIGKNEFRHTNVRTVPKLDDLAYTNAQTRVQRKQGYKNYLEVENIDFWPTAIGRMARTRDDGRAKPIAIAATMTNVGARTGRNVTMIDDDDDDDGDDKTATAVVETCAALAMAIVDGRLPGHGRGAEETTLILVDSRGDEWTVRVAGIPSRWSRFLSRLMDETVRDGNDRNGTTAVLRDADATPPARFTVMSAKTSYVTSSAANAFFRVRVDAFETSLQRTVHDYFVMAYERRRRRETARARLVDSPGTSAIFGADR